MRHKFQKGHIPWNKGKHSIHSGSFKKGHKAYIYWKGKHLSKVTKDKLRVANKGKHNSPKTEIIKGQRLSKKTEFKKGSIPFNKKHPEEKIIKSYLNGEKLINISNNFGCGIRVIHKILKRKNIELRDRPKGENHSNWRGGKSFEPYDKSFNNKFKRAIRKRDNYVCLKCLKHQEKEKESLNIHHINYDKLLSIPENCCTVCRKCNAEINFNRKHWIKFFQSLLAEKYGYKYSENNQIILEIQNGEKECST